MIQKEVLQLSKKVKHGADIIVDSLINHEVDYVFGIPGAKIDRVFDTLEDKGPELIVTRHETKCCFYGTSNRTFNW